MMVWWYLTLLLFLPLMGLGSKVPTTNGTEEIDRRLFVTKNLLDKDNASLAFYNSDGVEYYNGSHEEEWVQVYRGIYIGLGAKNTNFKECVEDGNKTVAAFRQSFKAFGDGQLFEGLHLFGVALVDVKDTLIACLQTAIAKSLEKFIKDLLMCTEGEGCGKFVIDALDILLIFYDNIYEIFGDIRAASNNFGLIQGYEQGGLCIGRVVNACI